MKGVIIKISMKEHETTIPPIALFEISEYYKLLVKRQMMKVIDDDTLEIADIYKGIFNGMPTAETIDSTGVHEIIIFDLHITEIKEVRRRKENL